VETKAGRISEIRKNLAPEAMLRSLERVRVLMVGRTQHAFDTQGRPGSTWKPRRVPNVAGILKDLERSAATPPRRRFEPRPAAIDTGALRASITGRIVGTESVEYGSKLAYADSVQLGKAGRVEITPTARRNLAALVKRRRDLQKSLGWLFNERGRPARPRRAIATHPPARPFVLFTVDDRKAVQQIVREEALRERGRGA
jgi:phage gpG-like protein